MPTYAIDRESDTPLYIQIRDRIQSAIASGDLRPGDRLPPVAALAREIGVTQATIRRALQDLGKAGHTTCHVGRGTFVRDAAAADAGQPPVEDEEVDHGPLYSGGTGRAGASPLAFAARRLRSGVSKALYDIMPLAHKAGILQMTKGIPDPAQLPEGFLRELAQEALVEGAGDHLEATEALGLRALRVEIARRFGQGGEEISPDQVLITNGAMQAINLVAVAALETRPGVICETPCFQGVINSFTAMGHWVDTVRRDGQGPRMDDLGRLGGNDPRLMYLCPYAHNPTGTDLTVERARQLMDWARRTDSAIIADEIFRDLSYAATTAPSLFTAMGGRQTIVVGSLSKTVASGLRVGWLIGSPERVRQLAELKRLMDCCTPTLVQGVALTLLTSGRYDAHVEKMRLLYRKRMAVLTAALEQQMPAGVTWTRPQGGFSIFVELPQGYSSVALLLSAIDRGISFLPGPLFDIDQRYVNALRLSVSWVDEHQIKEGVELLASAIEDFIRQPPGDSGLSGLGSFQ